jgi:hypothetical protein
MPSTSKKQHNFMAAIANSPSFAKKVGVPQSVGQDFSAADKGRKFAKGGDTMATKGVNPFAQFKKAGKDEEAKGKGKGKGKMGGMHMMPDGKMMKDSAMKMGGMAKYATGGFVRAADGVAQKGKTKAKQIKMVGGGKC